jgi:hypothetical protein
MASHRCRAVRKAVTCACITQSQHSVIPNIFHPSWTVMMGGSTQASVILPLQHKTTSEHPTRNMQSAAWNTATCEAVFPQPSNVTSLVSSDSTTSWRSFQTCQQTWTLVRILTFMHIIISVAWSCSVLYCLQASVSTSHLLRPQSPSGWTVWGLNPSGGSDLPYPRKLAQRPTHSPVQWWGGGARQSGHGDDHIHPSCAMKERVELHLNAPSVPTWQVTRWSLYFYRTLYYQCCHVQLLPEPSLNRTTQPRHAA